MLLPGNHLLVSYLKPKIVCRSRQDHPEISLALELIPLVEMSVLLTDNLQGHPSMTGEEEEEEEEAVVKYARVTTTGLGRRVRAGKRDSVDRISHGRLIWLSG